MFKLDIKINGRSVSSPREIERELKKAALSSAQEQIRKKVRHLPVRAELVERSGKYSVTLKGSPEAIARAKKTLGS